LNAILCFWFREKGEKGEMSRRYKVALLAALVFSITLLVNHAVSATPPVARFTYTPARPILGQVIIFNASTSSATNATILSYKWNFNDGSPIIIIADSVTTHNYTAYGSYNVTLTVTDSNSQTGSTWQLVTVRQYPVASFTFSPAPQIANLTVTFNASASYPRGGTIVSYYWNFGDQNIANVTTPITYHAFKTAKQQTYNVTLTVLGSYGLTATTWHTVRIITYSVASFTYSPSYPIVNQIVSFNASASIPNGETMVSYAWKFGDGATGSGKTVTHAYTAFGTYNVTLTVTNNESLSNTAWKLITTRNYPVASFTYSPSYPIVNQIVSFNASASTPDGGTMVSYAWKFGDGATGSGKTVTHAYTAFGTYTVTLNVTSSNGLSNVLSKLITILTFPVAAFTYSPAEPIINQTVTFNASASYAYFGSIVSYAWKFGDGATNTTSSNIVTHAYKAAGTYNVTLTVTDNHGLTKTAWKLITVYTFLYVHDVVIISVSSFTNDTYIGRIFNITVVAKNNGTAVESFTVTAYYNATPPYPSYPCSNGSMGTEPVTDLLPGKQITLTFSWNTTGLIPVNYTISARASQIPGETNIANLSLTGGLVRLKIPGDVIGDDFVGGIDISIIGESLFTRPGEPNWNPQADLMYNGFIGGIDISICGQYLFTHWP
jgi:PKD repeat protein